MNDPESDLVLYERWNELHDQDAVRRLWERYQRLAVTVAAQVLRGLPGGDEDARDVCDEGFLKALRTFDPQRAAGAKPFRNWFLTIVRRRAIDLRRRRQRETYPEEVPEGVVQPSEDELRLDHDVREVLPRLRRFVLEQYLPVDWAVFEQWMSYQVDGQRVPWKALAERFPVDIHTIVRFAPGAAELGDDHVLADVVHTLDVCPQLHVRCAGYATAEEGAALAVRRARVVQSALEERISRTVTTDRRTKRTEPRLTAEGREDEHGGRVEFEVTRGRFRTGDALRMRINKVILEKARQILEGDRARG